MRPTTDSPRDLSQLFDDLHDLDDDVEDDGDADEDDDTLDEDTGVLYGVRTPHAADRDLSAPEDQDGFTESALGETWLESLEHHAAEMGACPEEPVVVVEDREGHDSTERDRPVADKGSGGPGGR